MSLTRQIETPGSPLRQWFDTRLPGTPSIASCANRTLRPRPRPAERTISLRAPTSPPLQRQPGADPGLTGTALDLLVRATLAPDALQRSAALIGAGVSLRPDGGAAAIEIEREAVARIAALSPWRDDLDSPAWREVARLCLLLARFEQAARSRAAVVANSRGTDGVAVTLDAYCAALVNQADLDDVATAASRLATDLADLRGTDLVFGPVFAASRDLGGADADVISGDLLLDLKSTTTTKIVSRAVLLQLVGYALADTHDEYGIRRVGVAALRWRTRWTIALDELLHLLASTTISLVAARAEFAEVCARASTKPRRGFRSRRHARGEIARED